MWLPLLGCSYPSLIFLTVHEHTLCCCPLKYVEVCAWWRLYQGIICGAWGNGHAQEMAVSLAAQAWPLGSVELTL